MKKQILVDMDGVLADVYAQFINFEFQESGLRLEMNDLYGKMEPEAFPHCDSHVRSAGFFRNAPVMEGSIEGLKYLNDRYSVLIVSSATEFPLSLVEKEEWLNIYFPFIGWEQMIFCGRKDSIKGDVMIDDHMKNLGTFTGEKILFTQPHNVHVEREDIRRVACWKDIVNSL